MRAPKPTARYCHLCVAWGQHSQRAHHEPGAARAVAAELRADGRLAEATLWESIAGVLDTLDEDGRKVGVVALVTDPDYGAG